MKLHDITLPLSTGFPVWPDDPEIVLCRTKSISAGDACNLSMLQMGVHTGTHIDAPNHFSESGTTTDKISLETMLGPCLVVEINATSIINKNDLSLDLINGHTRILFKTGNSIQWGVAPSVFNPNFVALGIDAAKILVDLKLSLVGIDYFSIESFYSLDNSVHKLLLEDDITIIEGLNLSGIKPGEYELVCLPLSLKCCEGAPARVVLKEIELEAFVG